MVVKYKNNSPADNTLVVTHFGVSPASWSYFTPTQEEIDAALPIKARLEIHDGTADYGHTGYAPNRGVYVNGDLTVSGNISTNGTLSVAGSPVLTEANATSALTGQFVSIPNSHNGSLNSFLLEGNVGGVGAIPAEGAGARLMWYAEKAAFRAGDPNGTNWDDANVGVNSTAFGYRSQASGEASFAVSNSRALGHSSVALTGGTARGLNSLAVGTSTAGGRASIAMGELAFADPHAIAIGFQSVAEGVNSTARLSKITATRGFPVCH